ncbi:sensor histidine kinase [Fulvivirga imtechensis]|nr:HAMP domain-containing sensor histidine kinase [Fulvivirga imtechensis]
MDNTMNANNHQLVETLNERIKELTCLYEISNIVATSTQSLEHMLQSIVNVIPRAWKFPEEAVVQLCVDEVAYFSGKLPAEHISQMHPIEISRQPRGYLAIYYDASSFQQSPFLPEEQTLLKTLAQEIAAIIERGEQKKREELMQRKFQHNDRLAILGEITAGIAHELNTPLGNILGFSQLVQDRAGDNHMKKDIEKIINSAMHAREVVKKLMFFSCEMPQHMQEVSINALVEDALDLLQISFKNAGLTVLFKKDNGEITAHVDPVQFTQVVFNLLINAIHATPKGRKLEVQLERQIDQFILIIKDEGHGIEESIREKIFEPFFTTKATGKGSGLGLSVVHGIVKNHGGQIVVESEVDRGSTFTVIFPLKQSYE